MGNDAMKNQATDNSKSLIQFYQTTPCHKLEARSLNPHCSYNARVFSSHVTPFNVPQDTTRNSTTDSFNFCGYFNICKKQFLI